MRPSFTILIVLVFLSAATAQETKENADFKLAVSLYNDKLYDLALEQFRQFVATYPNTRQGTEARFYLGLTQLQLEQYEEARFTFQNFALSHPQHPKAPEAWWNVGEAYVKLGNSREAALAFERVKTFHPKSSLAPLGLLEAAGHFERAGDVASAKKVLRSLGQEYASADVVSEGRLKLARIYYSERQYELARSEAKRAADASADPAVVSPALQLMAESLRRLGKFEEAKLVLNESLAKFRSGAPYYEALLALGKLHWYTGNMPEALKSWQTIADPQSTATPAIREAALLESGDARMTAGSVAEALTAYERAAVLKGLRRAEAFFKGARAAERLGQPERAGDWYLRALEDSAVSVDRRHLVAGAFRGAILKTNNHLALRIATQFGDEFPNDPLLPRLLLEAAQIAFNLGDARRAGEFYNEVVALGETPYADDALFGVARSLRAQGEFSEALQVLERLEKQFPASDLLSGVREEQFAIRTFDLKNQDDGLRNLALLIGDVIGAKPREELAFRLGEIYFNDLKDYANAAAQYEAALRGNLEPAVAVKALFRKARALEFRTFQDPSGTSFDHAIAAYDSLLNRFPVSDHTGEARLARLRLALRKADRSVSEVRSIAAGVRAGFQDAREKARALLGVARAFQESGSTVDAAPLLLEVLQLKPSGEVEAEALVRLARAKFDLGDRDTAAIVLAGYLAKFPAHDFSADARIRLAGYEAEMGRVERALRLYQEIERQFPYATSVSGLDRHRADAYYRAGDYPNALLLYRRYLNRLADDPFVLEEPPADLLSRVAECNRKTGNRLEAKRLYAEVLARDTSSVGRAQVLRTLAAMAQEEGNLEAASRYLQEASRHGSGTPEERLHASMESAELLFRSEEYRTAVSRFEELLPRITADSLRQIVEARIIVGYYRLDNVAEADRRSNVYVRAYPNAREQAAEFEFERGRYHLRRDETDPAIRRFENVRQRFPRSDIAPEAVYWLARAMEMKSQPQRAVQLYDSLLQRFPGHPIIPRVQLSLGNVYYNLEQWDAAARQYKAVVENAHAAPDLVRFATSNLIMAYKEIGLFDAALQLTRQYIDRYPDDPDLVTKRIDIGVIFQKLGYYDQSILHLQSMLENATPELEGELRYYIGEAYFYKGDYQQAILEFLKVPYLITQRTKVDWVATSYYMAGQSYEKMSRFDQAITMYRQIIERPGIDATFKTAAQKEIDRVNALVKAR